MLSPEKTPGPSFIHPQLVSYSASSGCGQALCWGGGQGGDRDRHSCCLYKLFSLLWYTAHWRSNHNIAWSNPNHSEIPSHTHQEWSLSTTTTKTENIKGCLCKMWKKLEPLHIAGRNAKWCGHYGKQYSSSSKDFNYNYHMIQHLYLWIYTQKNLKQDLTDICTPVFIAGLSTIAKMWKQSNVHHQVKG